MSKSKQKLEDYSYWSVALIMDELIGDEGLKYLQDKLDPKTDMSILLSSIRKKNEPAILKSRKQYYWDAYILLNTFIRSGTIQAQPLGKKESPLDRLLIKDSFLKWLARFECVWSDLLKILGRKIPKEFYVLLKKNNLIGNTTAGNNLPEIFIKNLTVWAENDSEIMIKEPGKPPLPYSHKKLKFDRNNTKEWTRLLSALKGPDHTFFFNKTKGAEKLLVRSIEKKLLTFFKSEFAKDFPKGFKLIEKISDKPGYKKFKFKIKGEKPYVEQDLGKHDKESIIFEIRKLISAHASPDEYLQAVNRAKDLGHNEKKILEMISDLKFIERNIGHGDIYDRSSENKLE